MFSLATYLIPGQGPPDEMGRAEGRVRTGAAWTGRGQMPQKKPECGKAGKAGARGRLERLAMVARVLGVSTILG